MSTGLLNSLMNAQSQTVTPAGQQMQVVMIPSRNIIPNPDNDEIYTIGNMDGLKDDIQQHGLRQPLEVIPVDCDEWAMDGMSEIREQVDAIRDAYNPQLEVMGVLATKYTRGRYSVDTINEIANMDLPAFRNQDNSILRIDYSVKVKEAKARHLPVHKVCRNIKTSAQYKALAQLVKKCVEGE